jgi:hypothetical protein
VADNGEPGVPGSGREIGPAGAGGLVWSFELDLVSALEAVGRPLRDWDGVDQEEDLAAESAALGFTDVPPQPANKAQVAAEVADGRAGTGDGAANGRGEAAGVSPGRGRDLAGAIAEVLPTGPGLAAWLAGQDPADATDGDLVGMAGAFRRVASWAQARELELIAHVAARSAAADPKAGLLADGRPAHVTDDAAAQVSLELTLSRPGAEAWTGLAVSLRWRLPATAAALAEGRIDPYRAKIVAEAVISLSDAAAKAVEDRVIPLAGDLTYGQMHAAVRRAVIAADPEGAEHRRQAAERRAKVSLYPDHDGTATLAGYCLPGPEAAAAYAKITAIATAMKAAGAAGGIQFLRAQVLLGKILDTLPHIPPPPGGPPDAEPPPGDEDDSWTPPGDGTDRPPHKGPPRDRPPRDRPPHDDPPRDRAPHDDPPRDRAPHDDPPRDRAPHDDPPRDRPPHHDRPYEDTPDDDPPDDGQPGPAPGPGPGPATDPWPEVPPLTDADLPEDDGYRDAGALPRGSTDWDPARGDPLDDHFADPGVQWPWPPIPPLIPAAARAAAPGDGAPGHASAGHASAGHASAGHASAGHASGRPPPAGLLDLTLPWTTFTGTTDGPGTLGRIGAITAPEARRLASLALRSAATQWRIILTDADGHAIAVTRLPRSRPAAGTHDPPADATAPGTTELTGIIGRVTIVLPAAALDIAPPANPRLSRGIYARLLNAARRARDHARQRADADRHALGGCAHTMASPAYRPPPRIREHVTARDGTCRGPRCGQPAWRADLDHTIPYEHGGRTCPCDLGALCRRHHQLKQHPGWTLTQPEPGTFGWTTPAGRTYTTRAHRYDTD